MGPLVLTTILQGRNWDHHKLGEEAEAQRQEAACLTLHS